LGAATVTERREQDCTAVVGAEEMGRVGRREAVETVRVKGVAGMGRWKGAAQTVARGQSQTIQRTLSS